MALTKIKRTGLDTGITDNSDANAITIDSSENTTFAGNVSAISGTSGVDTILKVENNASNADALVMIDSSDNRDSYLRFMENGTTKWQFMNDGSDSDKLIISDDGNAVLTLDQSQNATFAGAVTMGNSSYLSNATSSTTYLNSSGDVKLIGIQSGAEFGVDTWNGSSYTRRFTITGTSSNTATFAGDVQITKAGGATLKMSDSYNTIAIRSVQNSVSSSDISFSTGTSDERMRITSAGNVGIGTTAPSELLHVKATSGNVYGKIEATGLNQAAGLYLIGHSGDESRLYFGDEGSSNIGRVVYAHGDNSMQFTTNSSEAMRIDSAGRVGIGTSSPSSYDSSHDDLVVAGDGNRGISIISATDGNATLAFGDGTIGDAAYRGMIAYLNDGDAGMTFRTSALERMRINGSGNVGIGTASPTSQMSANKIVEIFSTGIASLALNGNNGSRFELTSDTGDDFKISRNGSTALTIDGSNNNATFAGTISNTGLIYSQQSAHEDGIRFRGANAGGNNASIYYGKIGLGSGGYLQVYAEGNRSIDLKSGRQIRFFTSTDNSTYNNSVNFNSDGSSTFGGDVAITGGSTTALTIGDTTGDTFQKMVSASASGIQFQLWHGGTQTATINSNTTNIFSVYDGSAGATNVFNIADGGNATFDGNVKLGDGYTKGRTASFIESNLADDQVVQLGVGGANGITLLRAYDHNGGYRVAIGALFMWMSESPASISDLGHQSTHNGSTLATHEIVYKRAAAFATAPSSSNLDGTDGKITIWCNYPSGVFLINRSGATLTSVRTYNFL